jgi:hypothetical protein
VLILTYGESVSYYLKFHPECIDEDKIIHLPESMRPVCVAIDLKHGAQLYRYEDAFGNRMSELKSEHGKSLFVCERENECWLIHCWESQPEMVPFPGGSGAGLKMTVAEQDIFFENMMFDIIDVFFKHRDSSDESDTREVFNDVSWWNFQSGIKVALCAMGYDYSWVVTELLSSLRSFVISWRNNMISNVGDERVKWMEPIVYRKVVYDSAWKVSD